MSDINPFIAPPAPEIVEEELDYDSILGHEIVIEGITDPSTIAEVNYPIRPVMPPAPVEPEQCIWLVGTTGGAGISTLAKITNNHVIDEKQIQPPLGARILLVASTHAAGLTRAKTLALAHASGKSSFIPVGIVFIHDRPQLSKATVKLAKGIGRMFPKTFTIPYIAAWREPDTPITVQTVRLRRTVAALNRLAYHPNKK